MAIGRLRLAYVFYLLKSIGAHLNALQILFNKLKRHVFVTNTVTDVTLTVTNVSSTVTDVTSTVTDATVTVTFVTTMVTVATSTVILVTSMVTNITFTVKFATLKVANKPLNQQNLAFMCTGYPYNKHFYMSMH